MRAASDPPTIRCHRCGNNPCDQADDGGYAQAENNVLGTQHNYQAAEGHIGEEEDEEDASQPADEAKEDGLKEKLEKNEVVLCSQ